MRLLQRASFSGIIAAKKFTLLRTTIRTPDSAQPAGLGTRVNPCFIRARYDAGARRGVRTTPVKPTNTYWECRGAGWPHVTTTSRVQLLQHRIARLRRKNSGNEFAIPHRNVPTQSTSITFPQLVTAAEQLGANNGRPAVIGLYQTWIGAQRSDEPHLYAAWFNLGVELSCAGDIQSGIAAYQTAIDLQPDFAPAAINLGLLLERSGDNAAALAAWTRATQQDEARTTLLNHQARLLERTGQLEQAEHHLRCSLLTRPAQPDVMQHWIHIRQRMCAWPVIETERLNLSADELMENCGPLAALALSDNVAVQTRVSANWIARKTTPTGVRLSPPCGYQHKRIRIGYMSSDFCRHAMSFLITELFERHDRDRYEIFGYCSTIDDHSDTRRRVLAAFDEYRSIRDLSDEAAARLIRQDEIDILIDLNGLTQGARLQVLRWRPHRCRPRISVSSARYRYRNWTTFSATISSYRKP